MPFVEKSDCERARVWRHQNYFPPPKSNEWLSNSSAAAPAPSAQQKYRIESIYCTEINGIARKNVPIVHSSLSLVYCLIFISFFVLLFLPPPFRTTSYSSLYFSHFAVLLIHVSHRRKMSAVLYSTQQHKLMQNSDLLLSKISCCVLCCYGCVAHRIRHESIASPYQQRSVCMHAMSVLLVVVAVKMWKCGNTK